LHEALSREAPSPEALAVPVPPSAVLALNVPYLASLALNAPYLAPDDERLTSLVVVISAAAAVGACRGWSMRAA
jgi:hypothetical protein